MTFLNSLVLQFSTVRHTNKHSLHARLHSLLQIFENLIYLDLRRAGCEIYYYLTEDRCEVDFLVKTPSGKLKLFQVAWNVADPETLAREARALKQAEAELGVKGLLITPDVCIKTATLF